MLQHWLLRLCFTSSHNYKNKGNTSWWVCMQWSEHATGRVTSSSTSHTGNSLEKVLSREQNVMEPRSFIVKGVTFHPATFGLSARPWRTAQEGKYAGGAAENIRPFQTVNMHQKRDVGEAARVENQGRFQDQDSELKSDTRTAAFAAEGQVKGNRGYRCTQIWGDIKWHNSHLMTALDLEGAELRRETCFTFRDLFFLTFRFISPRWNISVLSVAEPKNGH